MVSHGSINHSYERNSSDAIRGYDVASTGTNAIMANVSILQQQPEVEQTKKPLNFGRARD